MKKRTIDLEQVRYIAHLTRLELSPDEEKKFTHQLGRILSYIEKLKELDTTNVPPTSHVLPIKNVLREDKLDFSLSAEEALSNAPHQKNGLFMVPKIVG